MLLTNLLEEVLEWDKTEDARKKRGEKKGIHRDKLQSVIRSCGVSFDIWEKSNADGKGSGSFDFTSLLGNDKEQLLRELPSKLSNVLYPTTSGIVTKLWEQFRDLYPLIGTGNPSDEEINQFFEKAKSWVNLFISLRGKRKGYEKAQR